MMTKTITNFNSKKWESIDEGYIYQRFLSLGVKYVEELLPIRVFDLLNLAGVDNNIGEEMIVCIYRFYLREKIISEAKIDSYLDISVLINRWCNRYKELDKVTINELVLSGGINEDVMLDIFDIITYAFYESSEYNSREYLYESFEEVLKRRNLSRKELLNG